MLRPQKGPTFIYDANQSIIDENIEKHLQKKIN